MKRRSRWATLAALLLSTATIAPANNAGAGVVQVPNLAPLPPFDIFVGLLDDPPLGGPKAAIRFGVAIANAGAYALEMRGVNDGDPVADVQAFEADRRPAYQCVWWVSRACTHAEEVGEFIWHEAHEHWHLEGHALYELRTLRDGVPDMTESGLAAPATKASFCLLDSTPAPESPARYDPLATTPVYQTCSEVMQGTSPGWADVYSSRTAGQEIPLAGIADGVYAIVVTVNPTGHVLETRRDDNIAHTVIEILDGGRDLVIRR